MNDLKIPSNLHSEKISLAAMLTFAEDLLAGRDIMNQSDYYDPRNARIHSAIVRLSLSRRAAGKVNLGTLQQFMEDEGTLEAAGGLAYLASLDETFPVRGSMQTYAGQLRELANRRAVITAAYGALEAAQAGEESETTMFGLERAIAGIRAEDQDDLISASQAVDMVNASLDPANYRPAFSTGIEKLDDKTMGGIRPGELWVCGALPSRGKSSVARQIAERITRNNVASLIFSLEMTVPEWWGVDQANAAGVEVWRLREPQYMTQDLRNHVRIAGESMRNRRMWFDPSSELHIDKIVAKTRVAVLQKGIQLVVVDYAQRVTGSGREMRDQMGDIARKLANLAKDNNIAVLLLSQLKRPNDINSKPSFEDLKESSYLGAHATTVLLNYRPVDRKTEKFLGLDQIIVSKQRHGPIGAIPVLFNGDTLRFDQRELTDDEMEDVAQRPRGNFGTIQGGRTAAAGGR